MQEKLKQNMNTTNVDTPLFNEAKNDFIVNLSDLMNSESEPVIFPSNLSEQQRQIWNNSTKIAWLFRLSDSVKQSSQDNNEAVHIYSQIEQVINSDPSNGYYIIYQLLSDSFETETEIIEEEGADTQKLNPISEDLSNLIIQTLVNSLNRAATEPREAPELIMIKQIISRSLEYVDLLDINLLKQQDKQIGNSYLRVKDIGQLAAILNEYGDQNTFVKLNMEALDKLAERLKTDQDIQQLFKPST